MTTATIEEPTNAESEVSEQLDTSESPSTGKNVETIQSTVVIQEPDVKPPGLPTGVTRGNTARLNGSPVINRSKCSPNAVFISFVKLEHRERDVTGGNKHRLHLVDANSDVNVVRCTEWVYHIAGGRSGFDESTPNGRNRASSKILLRIEPIAGEQVATAIHTYEVAHTDAVLTMASEAQRADKIVIELPFAADGIEWFHVVKWPIMKMNNDSRIIERLLPMLDALATIEVGMQFDQIGRIERISEDGLTITIQPTNVSTFDPILASLQSNDQIGFDEKPSNLR